MATAGRRAVLKIAYMGATALTSIETNLTSVSGPEPDYGIAEVSTLGNVFKSFIRTQINPGVIGFEGIYTHAMGSALHALGTAGTATGFELYPMGTAAGASKWSGSAIITAAAPSADRDDAVLFTGSMQLTGTPTLGTA